MEFKSLPFEVKADSNTRTFEGYASKFGNIDLHGDIIERGAFKKTLEERFPKKAIKVLWQHMEPIGMPLRLEEDDEGLYVEGKISNTRLGDEALTLMKDNVVDGMSIGYDVIQDELDSKSKVRRLKELKLFEVSVVTWGANPEAMVTNVKHLHQMQSVFNDRNIRTLEQMQKALDNLNSRLNGELFGMKNGNIVLNMEELKRGAVLNRKNRDDLSQAMALIKSVLDSAESANEKNNQPTHYKEPEPLEDETEDEFMDRCMGDEEMVAEFADEGERRTVCRLIWQDEQEDNQDDNVDDDTDDTDDTEGANATEMEELKGLFQEMQEYTKK